MKQRDFIVFFKLDLSLTDLGHIQFNVNWQQLLGNNLDPGFRCPVGKPSGRELNKKKLPGSFSDPQTPTQVHQVEEMQCDQNPNIWV